MGRPRADQITTATPERVLDAAQEVFADAGLAAAKLADIAERAGIRRPSLLHHFETKEALYAATVQRCFARLRTGLLEAMHTDGGFERRLVATVAGYAEFLEANPTVARLILRELVSGQGPGARILVEEVAPLVNIVEAFLRREGAAVIRPGVPVRAAVLQVASDILLRAAAGPLRVPLWGAHDEAPTLARILLLGTPEPGER
jgi:AcrR family transcriptional regulator